MQILLPLFGITARQAKLLRWMEVFMYTPAIEQVNLPSDKLQVARDILMLFYLFWTEENGFTWELYDDVCAAIARYTDYEVPTPQRDSTSILKALLIYVKRQVGEVRPCDFISLSPFMLTRSSGMVQTQDVYPRGSGIG